MAIQRGSQRLAFHSRHKTYFLLKSDQVITSCNTQTVHVVCFIRTQSRDDAKAQEQRLNRAQHLAVTCGQAYAKQTAPRQFDAAVALEEAAQERRGYTLWRAQNDGWQLSRCRAPS